MEFPPPVTPRTVSRREQAILGLLVAVFVSSVLAIMVSRSAGLSAQKATTAADRASTSADKIILTQEVNRQVGLQNRVVACVLLADFQMKFDGQLDLPSGCTAPDVVAASNGQLKAR